MSSYDSPANLDLNQMDTEHLTRQAIKLFSKRYGKSYDTLLAALDKDGGGYVTYEEFVGFRLMGYSEDKIQEAKKNTEMCWLSLTGGHSPTDISQLSRQKCIELCLLGFHSKDPAHVKMLRENVKSISNFQFDLFDTNKDGFISHEEFLSFTEKRGCKENWQGSLEAMDPNKDGQIHRDEFQTCALGFWCDIGEERFSHFFGALKN